MPSALTGTPGVGKTTVANRLREEGVRVLDLNEFIVNEGLREKRDTLRDSYEVNIEKLRDIYPQAEKHEIVEGHLSHYLSLSPTIVLRCETNELKKRMDKKGWPERKIRENIEAEIMDVILMESLDYCEIVCEIDTTEKSPEKVKNEVIEIINGKTQKYKPGDVDWSISITEI